MMEKVVQSPELTEDQKPMVQFMLKVLKARIAELEAGDEEAQ
jgi:hypothetical protein